MSLAIAVINSTVFDRLTTLERSVVLVAMPFEQSLVRWLAIAAEPPLPQAKIGLSPWMACLSAAAARSISDERTDVRPRQRGVRSLRRRRRRWDISDWGTSLSWLNRP